MRKNIKILISILITSSLLLASAGCTGKPASSTDGISVKVAAADKHKIQTTLNVTGVLVPSQTVNIVSKISGQATAVNFDVGSSVNAGDTLVTLETKSLTAQLQQAEASLQSAKAAAQSAKTQIDTAKINLDSATKTYDRNKALYDAGAVSLSQLEDASTKLDLAKKQYEAASGPSQNQYQASINVADANINSIKVQLDNAVMTSPINGIITNRNINPGELASPGAVLLTIADTSTLKLKSTVSQDTLPLLKTGQEIDVSIDIYGDKVFKGLIDKVGPLAVSTGKYFPIEIGIKNTGDIKAGLSAHASIVTAAKDGVIVPSSAVVQNNGQNYVFIIKDNVAAKRIVELGLSNDDEIEILKGLDAGEQVAVTNVNNLFDNMQVKVN